MVGCWQMMLVWERYRAFPIRVYHPNSENHLCLDNSSVRHNSTSNPSLTRSIRIALMLSNMPKNRKPSLVIAPPKVLKQWISEISRMTTGLFRCWTYSRITASALSSHKNYWTDSRRDPNEDPNRYDVILTTYEVSKPCFTLRVMLMGADYT